MDRSSTSALMTIAIEPVKAVMCSVMEPIGDGIHDISFVLRGPQPGDLSQWFDTYDGVHDDQPDWYALEFVQPALIDSLVFAHGPLFAEGGWWLSLSVQWRDSAGAWHPVEQLTISPDYDFSDARAEREPFESFHLHFAPVQTTAVRIYGQPGGSVKVTTLSYLAAGRLSIDPEAIPLSSLAIARPRLLKFLPANKLWDSISSLRGVTNIMFDVQTLEGLGLDHFLDSQRHQEFHTRLRLLKRPESLYMVLGDHEGWQQFGAEMLEARAAALKTRQFTFRKHHGGMIWVVLPIIIEDTILGTLENRNFICLGQPDLEWHQPMIQQLAMPAERYQSLLEEIPCYGWDELMVVIELVQQVVEMVQQRSSVTTSVARSVSD